MLLLNRDHIKSGTLYPVFLGYGGGYYYKTRKNKKRFFFDHVGAKRKAHFQTADKVYFQIHWQQIAQTWRFLSLPCVKGGGIFARKWRRDCQIFIGNNPSAAFGVSSLYTREPFELCILITLFFWLGFVSSLRKRSERKSRSFSHAYFCGVTPVSCEVSSERLAMTAALK